MTGGILPWLRTLVSGGIAAIGLLVLWSSWPDEAFRSEPALPGGPWTDTARAGWIAELPPPPLPADDDHLASDPDADRDGGGPERETPPGTRIYVVVKGDSLWRIAERELDSPKRIPEIERLNPGVAARPIHPGDELLLPADGARDLAVEPPPRASPPGRVPSGKVRRHSVGRGETLSRIGARYGVSAEAIFAANRDKLRSKDKVRAGQELRIPSAEGGVR